MLPIRAAQGVLALVVLGLSAYVANWYNVDTLTSSPSQINFLIFLSLYSIIAIAYLEVVPKVFPRAFHPYGALAMEFTNVLFWFAGFIALGVFLSKLLFCRGTVCGAAQADTVFSAFLFATWGASCALMGKDILKSGFRKPSPAVGPQMKETMA